MYHDCYDRARLPLQGIQCDLFLSYIILIYIQFKWRTFKLAKYLCLIG